MRCVQLALRFVILLRTIASNERRSAPTYFLSLSSRPNHAVHRSRLCRIFEPSQKLVRLIFENMLISSPPAFAFPYERFMF